MYLGKVLLHSKTCKSNSFNVARSILVTMLMNPPKLYIKKQSNDVWTNFGENQLESNFED